MDKRAHCERSRMAAWLLTGATAILGSCVSAGYAPPAHSGPTAAEQCPVGRIWVCRDGFDSTVGPEKEIPEFCICQSPQSIR